MEKFPLTDFSILLLPGPVNWLLSWRIWQPLAKLSFGVYLVHPIIMYWYYGSSQAPIHHNDYNMVPQNCCL